MANSGIFGTVGKGKGTYGLFGQVGKKRKIVYDSTSQAEADAILQSQLDDEAAKEEAEKQKKQSSSLMGKVRKAAKVVGDAAENAGKAIVRPVADVVTGKGSKAVHDTAQLASDITGGVANDMTNRVRKQVGNLTKPAATPEERQNLIDTQTKAAQAVKTGRISKTTINELNKIANQSGAGASTYKTALQEIAKPGSTDESVMKIIKKGQKLNANEEKSAAGAIAATATAIPVGEAARVAKGTKDIVSAVAKSGATGAIGAEGATLEHNPQSTQRELGTAGLAGIAGGALAPVVGKLFDIGADAYLSKVKLRGKESGMKDVMTPQEADKAAAAAHTKIMPTDESSGTEQVGVKTPTHAGIKDQSSTYQIGVRTSQKMSDKEYVSRFNALSKNFEKESNALQNLSPAEQKARGNAIDLKYQAKLADLDNEYNHGTLSKKTAPKKLATQTTPAAKTTGGAPKSGINVPRSSSYTKTTANISTQEATEKLKAAGYTPTESKEILQDALPDKPLSMPGTKPKIRLNDESVQKAAANFDEANGSTVEISKAPAPVMAGSQAAALRTAAAPESGNLRPLAATTSSETGTSKLGTSVREKAVQSKIISKTEAEAADLPTYAKANMKEQAQYATDLVKNDPQTAIDIALGKKEAPEHILPQMVYNAVEEYARGVGGNDGAKLLLELSRSRQVTNLTTMAQNIRAAAERDPHSPTNLINEVAVSRAQRLKGGAKTVERVAKTDAKDIKNATPGINADDWDSFVNGLRC